jgi:hypothetical protein
VQVDREYLDRVNSGFHAEIAMKNVPIIVVLTNFKAATKTFHIECVNMFITFCHVQHEPAARRLSK